MAKSKETEPVSDFNGRLKCQGEPTLPEVRNPSGPRVYDLSSEWSDNGVDPNDQKKPGV